MDAVKRKAILWIVPAVWIVLPGLLWAAPGDGIRGTKHDFSGFGTPPSGLCSFCHTSHTGGSQALLWNHTLSRNTFSWDSTETVSGTPYPTIQGDTYQGATAKCLSCHDGSVAVGDVVSWNRTSARPLLDVFVSRSAQVGRGGDMGANHPVAMPYPFNNVPSTYNGVTTGSQVVLSQWESDPTTAGIRLFHDDGSGNIGVGPVAGLTGIECSSCHDPHNGPDTEAEFFLRGTAGGICGKCHRK